MTAPHPANQTYGSSSIIHANLLSREELGAEEKSPTTDSSRNDESIVKEDDAGSSHSSPSSRSSFSTEGLHGQPVLTRTISEVRDGIETRHDVEIGGAPLEKEATQRSIRDPDLVTWDGPNDPKNPKLWAFKKKWAAISIGKRANPEGPSMVDIF